MLGVYVVMAYVVIEKKTKNILNVQNYLCMVCTKQRAHYFCFKQYYFFG